jgi:hypothetical protein
MGMSNWFGGNKGGAPEAPDFSKLAMVNQTNPLGGSSWTTDANGKSTLSSQFGGPAGDTFNTLLGNMGKAAGMDPTQGFDRAVNTNLDFAMSRLKPEFAQQDQALQSQAANSGWSPQSMQEASRQLGNKQSDMFGNAYRDALNWGNVTQRTQMAQAEQPFGMAGQMLGFLPKGNPSAPFQAGAAQYDAAKDQASMNNAKKGQSISGIADIGGMALGGF